MKPMNLSSKLALAAFFLSSVPGAAQEIVYDDFSMNPGYEYMVYYSVDSGVAGSATMASWDLAFDVRPMGGTASINGGQGMSLFPAGPLSGWDNIDESFANSAGDLVPFQNGTSYWSEGAFSQGGDGNFDLGWGVYDVVTHTVASDSMYVISLPDGTWKKFALLSLVSGVYSFQCADLDGSNFFEDQVAKSDYLGKIHAFYNLTNQEEMDLEPSTGWDMLFLRYVEEIQPGVNYGVTGALTHPNVRVQEQSGLLDPFMDGVLDATAMTDSINVVGWDWKTYAGGAFTVLDDRCYFMETVTGAHWRVVFTGFEGSMTGNVELGKVLISGADIAEPFAATSHLFPNPAHQGEEVILTSESRFSRIAIWSVNGAKVDDIRVQGPTYTLSTTGLEPGLYLVEAHSILGREVIRLVVQ